MATVAAKVAEMVVAETAVVRAAAAKAVVVRVVPAAMAGDTVV